MNCVSRCSLAFEICLRRRLTSLWACIVGCAAIQMAPVAAAQTEPLWGISVSKSAMLRQTSGTTVEEDGSTIRITVNHRVNGTSPHLNVELRGGGLCRTPGHAASTVTVRVGPASLDAA